MAKILIDTNILYDLAGINDSTKSSIDFEVLKNELSNLGELHVS